jgi:acetylornithine/N-succinyldiaminopimelate aminotransferase
MTGERLMPTYARLPVTLVRGEGCRMWADDGAPYLDLLGGLGALSLGHAHPRWVAAVTVAASTIGMTTNLITTLPQARLADRLGSVTPVDDATVFLCNSGAEANEAALKLVRKHGLAAGRPVVVALEGSFHGRTIATLAATGQPAKRAPFEPLVDWIRFVPPGDVDALDAALVPGDVGAVLLEPILGEGGVVPLAPEYLRAVRARCDASGALFAADEVQTGSGRTGRWLALEAAGVRPDVVALAKALGGGLPIGAVVARAELAFGPGEHGSTFGGGPVPSAAALAVLDTIEAEGLFANVAAMGALLRDEVARLAPAGALAESRGDGLLCGFRMHGPTAPAVVQALLARGVLASTAGPDVVRCTPPFTIGPDEIDEGAKALAAALEDAA